MLTLDTTTNSVTICGQTRQFPVAIFLQMRLPATACQQQWAGPDNATEVPVGGVTPARMRGQEEAELDALRALCDWAGQAREVALGDPGNVSHKMMVQETLVVNGTNNVERKKLLDTFLCALPARLERLADTDLAPATGEIAINAIICDAMFWVKSCTMLRKRIEDWFGLALAREILDRKSGGRVYGLTCPQNAVVIR